MFVTALMIVINQEDWVRWSLRSVYPAVDAIIITEGVARDKWEEFDFFTFDGLSTDRTPDEISSFIREEDVEGKVVWKRVGFQRSISLLRDMNMQEAPPQTTHFLVVDADHIYDAKQLRHCRDLFEDYPHIRTIYANQIIFFWDMHHILEISPQYRKPYGHHLSNFFFKACPGLHYNREATFVDNQLLPANWIHPQTEASPFSIPEDVPVSIYPPQFDIFHLAWVGSQETLNRHLLKTTWSRTLRMKWLMENQPERISDADRRNWMPFVGQSREEIIDWMRMYHKLYNGIFDDKVGERLVEYVWPSYMQKLMKDHPFWGKDSTWFTFGGMEDL